MKEITLTIDNLVCQGCAERITDILNKEEGVKKVKTKVMKKSVRVEFDPEKTSEEKLKIVLTETGYKPTE